jgi:hypothetical protein
MINPIHSNNSNPVNPNQTNPSANSTEAPPKPKNPAFDQVVEQTKNQNQGQKPNNENYSQTGIASQTDAAKTQGGINHTGHPLGQGTPQNVNPNPAPVKPAASTNQSQGSNLNKLV